jgi:hypothetical protein
MLTSEEEKCLKEFVSNDFVSCNELKVLTAAIFTLMLCKMFIIKCVLLYIMSKVNHHSDGLVVLQNCLDIVKSEPGSCTATCLMSYDDGNQVVGIKVEHDTDIKLEEDPGQTTSTAVKTEPAVSCTSVWVRIMHLARISRAAQFEVFMATKFNKFFSGGQI